MIMIIVDDRDYYCYDKMRPENADADNDGISSHSIAYKLWQ